MNRHENGTDWLKKRTVSLRKEVDTTKEKLIKKKPFTMIVTDPEEPIVTIINKINGALKTHIEERPSEGKVAVFYPLHLPQSPVADRITELVLNGTPLLDAEVQAMYEKDHGRTPDGVTFTLRYDEIEAISVDLNDERTEYDRALVEVLDVWTRSHPGKLLMVPDTKSLSYWAQVNKEMEDYAGLASDVDAMLEHTRHIVEFKATAESTQRTHSTARISNAMDSEDVIAGVGVTRPKNTLISRDLRKQKAKGLAKYDVKNIYPDLSNRKHSDEGKTIYYLPPEDALVRIAQLRKVSYEEVVLTHLSSNATFDGTTNQDYYRDRYAWIHEKLTEWDIEEYKHEAFEQHKKEHPKHDAHAQWQRDIIEFAIVSNITANTNHNYNEQDIRVLRDNFQADIDVEEKRWKKIVETGAKNKLSGLPKVTEEERQQALADSEHEYLLLLSKVLEKKIEDPKKIAGEFFLATFFNPLAIAEKLRTEQQDDPRWMLDFVIADLYEVASDLVITEEDILRIEKEEEKGIIDALEGQFGAEPKIGESGRSSIGEQEDDKNDDEKGNGSNKGKSK